MIVVRITVSPEVITGKPRDIMAAIKAIRRRRPIMRHPDITARRKAITVPRKATHRRRPITGRSVTQRRRVMAPSKAMHRPKDIISRHPDMVLLRLADEFFNPKRALTKAAPTFGESLLRAMRPV
jgi:hypothetical protein